MINIHQLTEQYFKCFQEKDINGLRELYDENVKLKDWGVEDEGIENMINANADLFKLNYELNVHKIVVFKNTTYNTISIDFGAEKIEIIDVIEFSDNKIISVRAYKG